MRSILRLTLLVTLLSVARSQAVKRKCLKNRKYSEKCMLDGTEITKRTPCRKSAPACCYDDIQKKCYSTTGATVVVSSSTKKRSARKCKNHSYTEKCIVDGEEITRRYLCRRKAPACCYDDKQKRCFSTKEESDQECKKFAPCTYIEDDLVYSVSTNQTDCEQKNCCWNSDDKMCYASVPRVEKDEGDDESSRERSLSGGGPPPPPSSANPFDDIDRMNGDLEDAETVERSLFTGPPQCQPPQKFPFTCNPINPNVPYVLEPPTDIPYCVRVPCSLDREKQSIYDKDLRSCGSQPGCYFDNELAEFRKYNVPTMPGVPVCHYAIRSAVFQREAQKVVDALGYWNPYFTFCTLETHKDEIYKGPQGCRLLDLLEMFGIPAKMAGWGSINEKGCSMIDACWRPRKGCFYPVDLNAIVVKSGQRLQFNPHEVVFGRPKCQHFSKNNSYEMLQSYHRCLLAGCSVDINILAGYYNNLFDIGKDMSPQDHWKYWEESKAGRIGAHNLDEKIYWPRNASKSTTTSVPMTIPFSNPIFRGLSGGIEQQHFVGTFAIPNSYCGPEFKNYGGRPCAPLDLRPPVFNLFCPYEVVSFPKFDSLKGSVEGCCDINECYITMKEIRKMHSGPTSYWSQWSFFSPCTPSCGRGTQTRTRKCIGVDNKKPEQFQCVGPQNQTNICNNHCDGWSSWSEWTECYPCTVPFKNRSRTCNPPTDGVCEGLAEESARCPPCFNG